MLHWELEDGGVQLLAQFLLSVRVNCRRGALVGIEGDSLQGLSSHVRHVLAACFCSVRVCMRHPPSASSLGIVTLATAEWNS